MPRTDGVAKYQLTDGSVRYWVRIYHRGRQYKWRGFLVKQEAKAWYQDRKRDVRLGLPLPGRTQDAITLTVTDVITRYLERAQDKKNVEGEGVYARFWIGWCGTLFPEQLTPERIDRARTQLMKHGNGRSPHSAATINRYVAWFHHVLKIEVDSGRLKQNPCALFVRSAKRGGQKLVESRAPEEEFSLAEEAALARALGPYADVPTFAIQTGLRQAEQFNLRWSDLDLAKGRGRIPMAKAGETQYFHLNSVAQAILQRVKQQAGTSPWVYPHPDDPTIPVNGKSWYNNVFKPAARRAGIVLSRKGGKTYHTLRHTFASRLQDAGGDIKDIKDAGRWKSWQALQRYTKRKDERVQALVEKLGQLVPDLFHSVSTDQPSTVTKRAIS